MEFALVVAMDEKRGIGKDGKLPWHIPADLQYFARLTAETDNPNRRNAVLMGRKSWESIPAKYQPLPGRLNIVLTHNTAFKLPEGVHRAGSLAEGLDIAKKQNAERVYVIGGGRVFEEAFRDSRCTTLYVTEVQGDFGADTFFPEIDPACFKRVYASDTHESNNIEFCFVRYERIP